MLRAALTSVCLCAVACGDPGGFDGGMGGGTGGAGGGGLSFDPDLPGINGTGTFLSEAERIAVVNAAKRVQAGTAGNWETQDAAMLAHLRADPRIEAAGVSSGGNVWARFIDGTLYLDFSRRDVDFQGVRRLEGGPRMLDLPGTRTAVTANDLQTWWPDASGKIGGWLAGKGYTVRASAKLRHQDLQAFSDVGTFFWQTHSGSAALRALKRDASGNVVLNAAGMPEHQTAFAYVVSNALLEDGGTVLTADEQGLRNRNRLALASINLIEGQLLPQELHFAVTNAFIEERMTTAFASNALVAIDSCEGAAGAPAFQKVMKVGAFVSWDIVSGKLSQLRHAQLFDRLLGQNAPPASTPLERPFDFTAVKSWMQKKGYDRDPSPDYDGGVTPTPAKLTFFTFGDFAILRPTITRLLMRASSVAKPFPMIVVEGTFGQDPGAAGTVRWGTANLQIESWTPNEIVVRAPGPPYPTGPVLVKVDERESNPAHFTVWNLPLTFTLKGRDTLQAVATFNCVFRSDVRGTRFEPEDVPDLKGKVNGSYLLDSGGTIVAGGNAINPTETWSGGSSLSPVPLDQTGAPASNYVACAGAFDGPTKKLTLQINLLANFSKNGGAGGFIQSQLGFPSGIVIDTVWPTRTLIGKTLPGSWPIPNETLTLSWTNVTPVAGTAPTDMDPR